MHPLPRTATLYLASVVLAAIAAAVPAVTGLHTETGHWGTFLGLAAGAALAQIFVVEIGRHHGFPVAVVFVVAAVLLLPVELVALVGIAQHLPDVFRRRFPWYVPTFNGANYTLNALAAWVVARGLSDHVVSHDRAGWALTGLAAAGVFVLLNHLLLAGMLRAARAQSFRESRLFTPESMSIDLVLAVLGVALAAFANTNPTLVLTVIAPLVLIHRLFRMLAAHDRRSTQKVVAELDGDRVGPAQGHGAPVLEQSDAHAA
jgi:hypothetical protein